MKRTSDILVATPLRVFCSAMALVLLAGCSRGSAVAPKPATPEAHARTPMMGRIPTVLSPEAMLKLGDRLNMHSSRHFASFNACPNTGTIIYVSDLYGGVNIYAGPDFAGQAPCGQLNGGQLANPQGMIVKAGDLYVANTGGKNILVYHRGATSPFMSYTDPGDGAGQYPVDVTVAADKTVIASNIFAPDNFENGSISTWHKNGTFVGNFPMVNDKAGYFVTVTKSGTLFFNDLDLTTNGGLLWRGSCPAGLCGAFTQPPGGQTATNFPGGLRPTLQDTHLTQIDQNARSFVDYLFRAEFHPTVCSIPGASDPVADDFNDSDHHVFWADSYNDNAGEMTYPGCVLKGTVAGNADGTPIGVAVDRPGPLDDK